MSISKKYIFQKVHETTSHRPSPPAKNYEKAVIHALFEENSAIFASSGQLLDEQLFKSCEGVTTIAKAYYKKVNQFWVKQKSLPVLFKDHADFYGKNFDFSKVDFSLMLSDIPQHLEVEDPIDDAVATIDEDSIPEVEAIDPIDEDPIHEAVGTISDVKSPGKRFAELGDRQQRNRTKKVRRSLEFDELMASAASALRERGNHFAEYCLKQIMNDVKLAEQTKIHIKTIKDEGIKKTYPTADPLDGLALLFKEDFSVRNYAVSTLRLLITSSKSPIFV